MIRNFYYNLLKINSVNEEYSFKIGKFYLRYSYLEVGKSVISAKSTTITLQNFQALYESNDNKSTNSISLHLTEKN